MHFRSCKGVAGLVLGAIGWALVGCSGAAPTDLLLPPPTSSGSDGGGGDSSNGGDAAMDQGTGDPGIACGAQECAVGNEVCCRTGTAQPYSYHCVATGKGCVDGELTIPCDDAADCDKMGHVGQVCCATYDSMAVATEVVCRSPTECIQANSRTNLCDPSVANSCPPMTSCKMSTVTVPGYNVCY